MIHVMLLLIMHSLSYDHHVTENVCVTAHMIDVMFVLIMHSLSYDYHVTKIRNVIEENS